MSCWLRALISLRQSRARLLLSDRITCASRQLLSTCAPCLGVHMVRIKQAGIMANKLGNGHAAQVGKNNCAVILL
jgi:hypothetical protein